jgi:hypothetical protein
MNDHASRLDPCQYLLVSQFNYTLTNTAFHPERFSHDSINHDLCAERLTPRPIWDDVRAQLRLAERGYLILDVLLEFS